MPKYEVMVDPQHRWRIEADGYHIMEDGGLQVYRDVGGTNVLGQEVTAEAPIFEANVNGWRWIRILEAEEVSDG